MLRGRALRVLGRWDEAVADFRRALAMAPLGAPRSFQMELAQTLAPLGYIEEARALSRQMFGSYKRAVDLEIAVAEADWEKVVHITRVNATRYFRAAYMMAAGLAAMGKWAEAQRTITDFPNDSGEYPWKVYALNHFRRASGKPLVWRPEFLATLTDDPEAIHVRGLGFAALGQIDSARAQLRQLRAYAVKRGEPGTSKNVLHANFLEASIAARQQHWPDVIRLLGANAWKGLDAEVMPQRWMVAEAHEQLGRPDSAIAYLELIAEPRRAWVPQHFERPWFYPFAVRRLALLHGQLGHPDRAREYWLRFLKTFKEPDPEFLPLVEEAKVAIRTIDTRAKR
jgi:tetratricopeptide (TPR) repeat protein